MKPDRVRGDHNMTFLQQLSTLCGLDEPPGWPKALMPCLWTDRLTVPPTLSARNVPANGVPHFLPLHQSEGHSIHQSLCPLSYPK